MVNFCFMMFYGIMIDSEQLLLDLFQAYYDARKHKRNTRSAVAFEMNYETKLFQLYDELITWTYTISPSISFVINDPVQREIFAADFRDRIIHHLIYNYIYEIFDRQFIYDSYSCRLEKWTHFGIQRIDHFIRSCTDNYSNDAYILKLDIKWFFMHIDYDFLINLIHQVIFHDATKYCDIKWKKSDRKWLPTDKSLFYSSDNTGLAIWNLTSQLFANIYLDCLDKYIKYDLWFRYYGRYVDDFVIIDTDKQKLLSAIPMIRNFLSETLHLTLHPKKIYFQQYNKWVQFLGAYIRPYRSYIRKRTIGNFYQRIQNINTLLQPKYKVTSETKEHIMSVINSYLWTMKHYQTYTIRKKMFRNIYPRFWNYFNLTIWADKIHTQPPKERAKRSCFGWLSGTDDFKNLKFK